MVIVYSGYRVKKNIYIVVKKVYKKRNKKGIDKRGERSIILTCPQGKGGRQRSAKNKIKKVKKVVDKIKELW